MNILDHVLNIVAPHDCLVCGQEGSLLCAWCINDALPVPGSACFSCGADTTNFAVCTQCQQKTPLRYVWFTTEYKQAAKDLIRALKFQQKRQAARAIAQHMDDNLPFFEDTVIVPIPTAPNRVRQRGFDQSLQIARHLAKLRGLPLQTLLVRTGSSRQVGQSRRARTRQIKGAFRVRGNVRGKTVLLIDDVVTTGATLSEAAKTLQQNGARAINAAVFTASKSR